MTTREPFFAKYIEAAERAHQRDEEDAVVTELSFAQETARLFRGGVDDCA